MSLQSDSSLRCCGFIKPPASSPAAHADVVEFELSTLDTRFGSSSTARSRYRTGIPVSIEAAPADRPCTPSSPPMRPAGGAIEIDIGNARVRLRGGVDEASLRMVLTALRSLA